jgi:hypothetical protein
MLPYRTIPSNEEPEIMRQRVVKEETLTAYSLYSQLQLSLVMDKAYLGDLSDSEIKPD